MSRWETKAITVVIVLLIVFGLFFALLSYKQVPEGHQGVTTEWGAVTGETLDSGAHWKVPIMQGVQDVEIRPRTYTMSQTEGEGDKSEADAITVKTVNGSSVNVDLTIRYRINASEADQFVKDWKEEDQMEQRLIRPTVRSELRDEASDIQTSDIYTRDGREALAGTAQTALETEFADEPIVLESVQVRNIDLPDSIDDILDRKEQAKQQVQVEQQRVQQERQRAEQKRVEAQAEADVIDIRGDALDSNPIVLQARLIDAYDDGTVFVTSQGGEQFIIDAENVQSGNETSIPVAPETEEEGDG